MNINIKRLYGCNENYFGWLYFQYYLFSVANEIELLLGATISNDLAWTRKLESDFFVGKFEFLIVIYLWNHLN